MWYRVKPTTHPVSLSLPRRALQSRHQLVEHGLQPFGLALEVTVDADDHAPLPLVRRSELSASLRATHRSFSHDRIIYPMAAAAILLVDLPIQALR